MRMEPFPLSSRSVPGFPTSPLSPATTYVVLLKENHMQLTEAATLNRKSGGAEGSAVPRASPGNAEHYTQTELSSRPERTRISCHSALDMATCAALVKESRMKIANATKLNRKSGVAQWRDLRFSFSSHWIVVACWAICTATGSRNSKQRSGIRLV
jgi:hypothetical protein